MSGQKVSLFELRSIFAGPEWAFLFRGTRSKEPARNNFPIGDDSFNRTHREVIAAPFLGSRRVNPFRRDAPIDGECWLHITMRLIATRASDTGWIRNGIRRRVAPNLT